MRSDFSDLMSLDLRVLYRSGLQNPEHMQQGDQIPRLRIRLEALPIGRPTSAHPR